MKIKTRQTKDGTIAKQMLFKFELPLFWIFSPNFLNFTYFWSNFTQNPNRNLSGLPDVLGDTPQMEYFYIAGCYNFIQSGVAYN